MHHQGAPPKALAVFVVKQRPVASFLDAEKRSVRTPVVDVIDREGAKLSPEPTAEFVEIAEQARIFSNGRLIEPVDDCGIAQFSAELLRDANNRQVGAVRLALLKAAVASERETKNA